VRNNLACFSFSLSRFRAVGCGGIAVKRYEDARRDGDNILAIIKGSAVNNDGTGTSFGTPNEKAQERVYRTALKRANVAPSAVSFVETHGTGTVVGKEKVKHMTSVSAFLGESSTNLSQH